MNKAFRRIKNKKYKKEQKNYNMIATAEIYNQKPEDPIFKRFSLKAMEGIKLLAESLKRHGLSDTKEGE